VTVVRVLERNGGVLDARTLRRYVPRKQIRTALDRGMIVRDGRGRYALPGADEDLRAANGLSGVLCLDSAARQHGWKLARPCTSAAVAVPRNRKLSADRRAGLRIVYADLAEADVNGLVTGYVRTVMDCAARMPFPEALAIADSALRAGHLTRAELRQAAERQPARYRARCRKVARHADGRADNPFESVLRAIAIDVPGLQVQAQRVIPGIGRPDLADPVLGLVIEADSFEFHGRRAMLTRDCERYNAFVVDGWLVIRFAWEHVMLRPDYVERVLRDVVRRLGEGSRGRALGRGEGRLSA
jgi:very-short-patch-repair endonuclease